MTFVWQRGVNAASGGSGSATGVHIPLALYAPSTERTVRRTIIDYDVHLQFQDGYGYPTSTKVTLGVITTTGDTDTPPDPAYTPYTNPNAGWNYWRGASWWDLTPGFSETLFDFSAAGRIDFSINNVQDDDLYTRWWLVVEVDDSSAYLTSWEACAWWQSLSQQTGL